jgi:hypothetical protein
MVAVNGSNKWFVGYSAILRSKLGQRPVQELIKQSHTEFIYRSSDRISKLAGEPKESNNSVPSSFGDVELLQAVL